MSPREILVPFFEMLPLESAMPQLVPSEPQREAIINETDRIVDQLISHPALVAGLWLYVDDLERSHEISMNMVTPVGAYWHGIMHRREGDFWNSKYWLRQAGSLLEGFHSVEFVDRVEAADGEDPVDLLTMQRQEWQMLFDLCLAEGV